MTILATVLAGSKLYRLDNAQSDTDYKGIFLPPREDCLLMRASRNVQAKSGEGAAKVEHESFALQEFLKLAANGEDIVVTMLHAAESDVIVGSPTFQFLRYNRSQFYTKRMVGSLGYAKSQATKYAMRADRMAAVERVIGLLEKAQAYGVGRLSQCWEDLTEGEHVTKTESPNDRGTDKRVLDVAGKLLPATITPAYALDILCKLRDNYGDRVKAAKNIDGKDMKSISHSFRVGYQLLHVYQDGGFSYPLPESDFIRAVKESRLNYLDDKLDEKLNALITQVEALAEASTLPARVSQDWLDSIVLSAYA